MLLGGGRTLAQRRTYPVVSTVGLGGRVGTDFRSDRMDSPEGRGWAKDAWDAYARTVNKVAMPVARPLVQGIAAGQTVDLMGFWLVWHLEGGYEGLRKMGLSRSAIYRRTAIFRRATGYHPDEFQMPGVEIKLADYMEGSRKLAEERARKS